VLIRSGQSNQKLFIILSGSLTVHLDSPESDPVAILDEGETVGELSVIDDSPASAFVVAKAPSRILEVDESAFWGLISTSHAFACNMLLLLADRMRSSDDTITENIRMRRRFEKDAMLDVLTGMKNRRWIEVQLPRLVSRHQRSEIPLSLIMFDVDFFKKYNDRYGHDAGDDVLASVARMTADCLRPTDLSARYGGEEFVIILAGVPMELAWIVAERVRKTISETKIITTDGRVLPPVTVSLGIAQAEAEDDAGMLLKKADTALYRAKSSGRNCTCKERKPTQ
ncbi:MAG TPA: GGDEF domain-containing protein, partial [Candidatus Sabulitectum sp.]|nr:GGDEF domain-containing protein [Candidatus Sabulitectum sp.]